jgi:lipopolysaccharide export LptBFGC system permease protein LptF
MSVNVLNRMVVAVGIGAVALFGLSVPSSAQPQPQQETKQQQADRRARQEQDKQQQQQRQRQRLAPQDQQALIGQQQQRLAQYRDHLGQQQRLGQQQAAQLQGQKRMAQYRFQQQYVTRLRQQQVRVQGQGGYNYGRDPYFSTPASYRYSRGGRYYETNQYGVDLLRQAVNYGYDQGCRAGLADRQDRWQSNYHGSYAYQDANYGYTGFYVDRDDYNTYFREGFRRGYEDGYNGRYQYGRYANGRGTMLGAVLATILNFESIR